MRQNNLIMKNITLFTRILPLLAVLFISNMTLAQFPEGFETSVPPAGWIAFENGTGTTYDWEPSTTAYSGSSAAYVRYESVASGMAEDWLVTPSFTVGANSTLEFYQRQAFTPDWGTTYEVKVSTTDQTTTANFTTVDTQVETDFSTTYSQKFVDLSAYTGQTIWIAFVMTNDDGDSWYIDDVNMIGQPCYAPSALSVANITTTTADFSWTGGAGTFDVAIVPTGSPISGTLNTPASPYLATGLTAATAYDFYVREACTPSEALMITAAYDGPLTGGTPKGIELYVLEDIADLSEYGVSSANNGSGTTAPNAEYTFPAVSATAGDYIYVTTDSANFNNFFGFDADFISGSMSINGDDAVELFKGANVIDVFGDVNQDGTGTAWDHVDGWAYRNSGSLNNYGTWLISEWSFSGINALDNETTNATAVTPVPVGTFTTTISKSTWEMLSFITDCGVVVGDSLEDPIVITADTFNTSGSTAVCYTDHVGNSSADVFYQYVVSGDSCVATVDVSLCGSSYDTYLRIWDTAGNSLATNDDACGTQSEITGFAVAPGDTLIIVIEGFGANTGDYVLNITPNYTVIDPLMVYSQMDVLCAGDSTGSVSVGNGNSTLNFLWDDANAQTDSTAINLAGGTYTVTAFSAPGCFVTETVTILDTNAAITTSPVVSDVLCFGEMNGAAVLNETGGLGTLTADWGSADPTMLAAGTYVYTVMDTAGCMMTDSITVNEPTDIVLSGTATDEMAGNDGAIDLTVSGGTAPYSFMWDNGAGSNEDPSGLAGNTTYLVTVTDDNGCTDTLSIYVGSQLSVDVNTLDFGVSIYPNPSNGVFTITFDQSISEGLEMVVTNLAGQVIATETLTNQSELVELNALSAGQYIITINGTNGVYQSRFSVVK